MFKKLLSNLPYNPSLISQVGFYTKRLKAESSIRRMGVIMLVLSVVVQGFAIASPVRPAQASTNDMFPGGFANQAAAVNACNANSYDFKTILAYFGINCQDLFFGSVRKIDYAENGGQMYSMGRNPYGFASEVPVSIPGSGTYYMRQLTEWGAHCWDDGAGCQAIVGTRSNGTPFWVLFGCGNVVIQGPPQPPEAKIVCEKLDMSVPNGTTVDIGSTIRLRGYANGSDLPNGELVDMTYEFVRGSNGQLIGTAEAKGIPFSGNQARDTQTRDFKMEESGDYIFRLVVKHKGGSKEASGNRVGQCVKNITVKQDEPEKIIVCDELKMSVPNKSEVELGTDIEVTGQATGQNVKDGDLVDMYYEFVDASNGVVLGQAEAKGIKFASGTAMDSTPREFKVDSEGTFIFRLAVKQGDKNAVGNLEGDCVKEVTVKGEAPEVELHKKVTNETQNIQNANGTKAQPGDKLVYTLEATNLSDSVTIEGFVVEENIADILEYAKIVDLHGGEKDDNDIVRWPAVDIAPGETIEQKLTVRVKDPIPQNNTSPSGPGSYDLIMTNVYGDTVNVELPPSVKKRVEIVTTTTIPNTGPGETLAAAFTITVIASYFLARSRLMSKELAIVKEEYATGAPS